MNEKLEKEISAYMHDNLYIETWSEFCDIAEHFYNLALQDVKIKLERFIREKCCPGYSGINVCRDMIKFIDKLTE